MIVGTILLSKDQHCPGCGCRCRMHCSAAEMGLSLLRHGSDRPLLGELRGGAQPLNCSPKPRGCSIDKKYPHSPELCKSTVSLTWVSQSCSSGVAGLKRKKKQACCSFVKNVLWKEFRRGHVAALTAPSGCCVCGKHSDVGRSLHSSKSAANTPLVHSQVRTRTEVRSWRPHLYIRAVGHGVLSFLISNRWPCHQMHCTLLLIMPKPKDSDSRRLKIQIFVVRLHFCPVGTIANCS